MIGREVYKIWAPTGKKWIDWVRPVPFVLIDDLKCVHEVSNFFVSNIDYIDKIELDTAIIVDLPGELSVKEGIALAKIGFRPIPIYNGTNEQKGAIATVDNFAITTALICATSKLEQLYLENDTPPAFLLDSNRMNRYKMDISVFDNSWDIYPHDLPSAEYFVNNGINKIIVVGETIQKDLKKILYNFQKKGISILHTNGYEKPKVVRIKNSKKNKI